MEPPSPSQPSSIPPANPPLTPPQPSPTPTPDSVPTPPAPTSAVVPPAPPAPPPAPLTPTASPYANPAMPGASGPAPTVGDGGLAPTTPITPAYENNPNSSPGGIKSKKLLIGGISVLALIFLLAIWYFGYFTNPSVVYSQSLKNTGKGYDKLVDYVDTQQKLGNTNGYVGSGSYKVDYGDTSTDGKIAYKSNNDASDLTFDVGLGVTRVNAEVRTIQSSAGSPDIYVKAANIKGLGTVIGAPQLDANLAKIDNAWVVIDHTLLDNIGGVAADQASTSSVKGPTRDQVLDEARAFGKVNQQYLFSTSKDKAVTKVVKSYGAETVEGHKAYHYKIALQKDNVKKYIYAQRDALKASKLNAWLKQNKYDQDTYSGFNDAADSTKDIKSTDTYDIWMDAGKRVVYKIRFSEKKNPADNYVDVGLDYKGGDIFPFFVYGAFKGSQDSGYVSFITTLNTKTSDVSFKLKVKDNDPTDSSLNTAVDANFVFKPSKSSVKISKPSGAISLSQVLSDFGYGDLLNQYILSTSSAHTKAEDTKRETDIQSIQTQLEAFFSEHGYYPSLSDMNNASWLSANMKSLDQGSLTDPSGTSKKLAANPAAGVYAYQVTDANGASCEKDDTQCAKYTLTATFSAPVNGQATYTKSNLD